MSSFRFNHEGGIERASSELAVRLAKKIDLTLVATQVTPPPEPPLRWQPVRAWTGPDFLTPVTYSRAATRTIAQMGFDLTHNQGGCALTEQDIITAHSCHRAWWMMKFKQGEALRAIANPHHHAVLRVEGRNYRPGGFRRVIAVSHGVGREVSEHYEVPPELISVIPNAVDAARFQPVDAAARRARIRAEHGLDEQAVALLFVGKEFRRKGLAVVIDALGHLPAHVHAIVVGGDDQRPFRAQAIARGVADRVIFVGHSPHVEDYFQAGDVFVFPTLYEAFALVSLEAAAAGLPLVTTRVNGTEDFVVDGTNGYFTTREGAHLAAVLRPLIDDSAMRRRLGAKARADVASYTWDAVSARTLDVYESVWEEKRFETRRSR